MRGLSTGAGPDPRARHATKAVITASAVLAALGLFVSACATGGTGARDEGPADNDPLAKGAATPTLSASASSVHLKPRLAPVRPGVLLASRLLCRRSQSTGPGSTLRPE